MNHIVPADARLRSVLVDCARDLFAAYGLHMDEVEVAPREHEIAGLIGFTGAVRGTLFVASTLKLLAASCQPPHGDIGDWTGELANQLLGRWKNQLLRHGIVLAMATPVAVRGLRLSCSTEGPTTFAVLQCELGAIVIGLEAILEQPLEWRDVEDAAAAEGSLELF